MRKVFTIYSGDEDATGLDMTHGSKKASEWCGA